jgi:hypothetical protein
MHNLDRTLSTHEQEVAFESDEVALDPEIFGQTDGEVYGEVYGETYGELSEEEELDLAHELLAVQSEEELDFFLGKLLKKVGKVAKPLGKFLKPLAKAALPIAGKVAGGFFGGPLGATIGGKLGSFASNLFEVNYEAMEPGEAEVDAARRFVRLANASVQQAAAALGSGGPAAAANPVATAKAAVNAAARTHAPGLAKGALSAMTSGAPAPAATISRPRASAPGAPGRPCACGGRRPQAGRWIRRGQQLVVFGV